MQNRNVLFLSLPLAALTIMVSSIGLLTPDYYSAETLNWQAQSTGQDLINVFFITPCLLFASILAYRNKPSAIKIWGGVVLYLTYTFVIYCFDVHFNSLFIFYCCCLGLSFYSLIYFLFTQNQKPRKHLGNKAVTRYIGVYFISIATLFYLLWLSEIIPATIHHSNPKSVSDAGLFTNGVHVIDLSVILPAIFVTGIFLLKRVPLGFILTPILLTFFILMDITIGMLTVVMNIKGVESGFSTLVIMGCLAVISLALLIWFLKSIKTHP
jgi:hypothetical protein